MKKPKNEVKMERTMKGKEAPSTGTTASTKPTSVEAVVPVESGSSKYVYLWLQDNPLDYNFRMLGASLKKLLPDLLRHADGGLVLVEDNRHKRIRTAKELAPLLIDTINIQVFTEPRGKGGERKRVERLGQSVLTDMLASRSFLDNFPLVKDIVTTPIVLPDFTPSTPGFNTGILHLGPGVEFGGGLDTLNKFLDVMEYDGNASRTNVVAAALTILFRHHWYGAKPLVLVTANKSHSGKGTICNFVAGNCPKVDMLYSHYDWPMEQALQKQLTAHSEVGVIVFDNVRLGSSGGGSHIRSGLFESFITNEEFTLSAAKLSSTFRSLNKYVVILNTNEGVLSADLLNRSLHIGLHSTGDMEERLARAREKLGGDVKTEWLPANQPSIQAELWGMVNKWLKEGKPLDENVKYPMAPWAKTIGGILMVNGFKDFLGNYRATRAAVDLVREAIGQLAFYASNKARSDNVRALATKDLGKLVVDKGLDKTLVPRVSNEAAVEREIGRRLSPYDGETFTVCTATETITYKLHKKADRWTTGSDNVSYRYVFEEIKRSPATNPNGVVLEEPQKVEPQKVPGLLNDLLLDPKWEPSRRGPNGDDMPANSDLDQYEPEVLPG